MCSWVVKEFCECRIRAEVGGRRSGLPPRPTASRSIAGVKPVDAVASSADVDEYPRGMITTARCESAP